MNDDGLNFASENNSERINKSNIVSNPVAIQMIIETLSERTRLFILKCLQDTPYGLMATDIANRINKKVPTVLYHLDRLRDAGIVYEEIKPRAEGEKREVKHWLIADQSITLDIELESLCYLHRSIDSYILSFLSVIRKSGIISQESLENVSSEDIGNHQKVSESFATVIKENLTVETVVQLLSELLDVEFTKINKIEKDVKAILKKNYLHEKALNLLSKPIKQAFSHTSEHLVTQVGVEILKRNIGTAFSFKTFVWNIAEELNIPLDIPIRLKIDDISIKFSVSIELAVRIR
ncbi:MAG: ArsR/SmtB family transcription factor, partial [Candidatus Hodarchaeota archaeon]